MKKVLRIGLIGFGAMGKTHTWAVQNLPFFFDSLPFDAKIEAVLTTSAEKSEAVAKQFGFGYGTDDEEKILTDPKIDVIDVCSPNHCHFETLKKAIGAKKHVLCEKPLCKTKEEADEIVRLSAGSPFTYGVVFNNRWLAPVMRAKQLIDEGRLGKILRFSATYLHNSCIDPERTVGWKQDKNLCGAGTLFDIGSHVIDLTSHLCGKIVSVSGHSQIAFPTHKTKDGTLWQTNADEAFDLLCVTEGNAHGVISVSKVHQGVNDDLSFEVSGERGAIRFSLMEPNWLYFYDATAKGSPMGGERGFCRIECVGRYPDMVFPSPKAPVGWLWGHLNGMKNFLSCVAENKPFSPNFADGAYVQSVMDAALRSDELDGVRTEVLL